jgi:hypothetical protein
VIVPDEELGVQEYLYMTDRGRAGYNAIVGVTGSDPLALNSGRSSDDVGLDRFEFEGLSLLHPEPLGAGDQQ